MGLDAIFYLVVCCLQNPATLWPPTHQRSGRWLCRRSLSESQPSLPVRWHSSGKCCSFLRLKLVPKECEPAWVTEHSILKWKHEGWQVVTAYLFSTCYIGIVNASLKTGTDWLPLIWNPTDRHPVYRYHSISGIQIYTGIYIYYYYIGISYYIILYIIIYSYPICSMYGIFTITDMELTWVLVPWLMLSLGTWSLGIFGKSTLSFQRSEAIEASTRLSSQSGCIHQSFLSGLSFCENGELPRKNVWWLMVFMIDDWWWLMVFMIDDWWWLMVFMIDDWWWLMVFMIDDWWWFMVFMIDNWWWFMVFMIDDWWWLMVFMIDDWWWLMVFMIDDD